MRGNLSKRRGRENDCFKLHDFSPVKRKNLRLLQMFNYLRTNKITRVAPTRIGTKETCKACNASQLPNALGWKQPRPRCPRLGPLLWPLMSPGCVGMRLSVNRCSELVGVSGAFWNALSFGFRSWTGNEPISGNPSGVPILDCLATHGALKAANLACL